MSTNCTWVHCLENATQPQRGQDGSIWANLCGKHEHELEQACRTHEPAAMMRAWVLAQGGSEAAAARMAPEKRYLGQLIKRLRGDT